MAVDQFEMIVKNIAPGYLENIKASTSAYKNESCIVFFFDSFYERLFTIHPSSANLFTRGMRCQGNALVQMINIALTVYKDDSTFNGALKQIAEFHYQKGVKAYECELSQIYMDFASINTACFPKFSSSPVQTTSWARSCSSHCRPLWESSSRMLHRACGSRSTPEC